MKRHHTERQDALFSRVQELVKATTFENTLDKLSDEDKEVFSSVFGGIAHNAISPSGSILKSIAFAFALGHEWATRYWSLWPQK